ncbi:MAG: LPS export ABC transporter periplasmic protein LptC [Pseudomonadota bacterium]
MPLSDLPRNRLVVAESPQAEVSRYSRRVRWMKVALPLFALVLVGAIFLVGRGLETQNALLSPEELARLSAGLKLERPRFAGRTEAGEPFVLRAVSAEPDGAMPNRIRLGEPDGELTLSDGRLITGRSDTGTMLRLEERLILDGAVRLDSSDGYRFEADRMIVNMGARRAKSIGPVRGQGPAGTIEAGAMRLVAGPDGKGATRIFFERRVRVVFIPPGTRQSAARP